jgi:hypothetical protein
MPPGAVSSCAAPTPFTYSAKITASAPDTVSYRWVYSSGKEGQVQNLPFSAPGSKQVSSVVQAQAPGGWAAIQLIHPRQPLSNKVPYTLLCHKTGSWVIVATAAAHLAAGSVTCGTPPPPVTFTGTIESPRAAQVTYYWALSNGYHTPSAPLTFSVPGTKAVPPYRFTPPDDKATGDATLVVTSPVPAASSPAPYALTCKSQPPPPGLILKATASVSPQTATIGCFATQPAFTFSGTIYASRPTTVYYYWVLPDGTVSATYPLKFTQAGTQNVTPDPYTPDATSATGSGYFHIASPIYSTPNSNLATFTLSCTQPTFTLSTPTSAPPTPDSVQCGSTPPTFTVTSTITSDQNVMADYQWVRSDGSVNPAQPEPIQLTAGDPHQVTDDVTATSDSKYSVTDTLEITSPVTKDSNPITLSVSCKYPPLVITTPTSGGGAPPVGAINIEYPAFSFGASGGDGSPLKWVSPPSTEPGSFDELPPGLSINPASGAITGTPTGSCDALAYCTYTFTVDVSDDNSALSATGTYSINVYPALTITTPVSGVGAPPLGVVDIGYPAFSFEASFGVQGDHAALTWAWTQTLAPPGLTLTPSGAITGTPTTAGTYTVPVTVTNGDDTDQTATQNYTITINPPLSIDPPPAGVTEGVGVLPSGTWETPYSFMFTAAGGEGPYTWTATATESQTGPPPGLSIGPGDDTLSGTPTLPATSVLVPSAVAEGTTYTFTVTVTDSEPTPVSVPMTFEITIEPATSDLAILHAGRPSRKITVQVQADKAAEPVGQLYPPHPSSVADLIPAPGLKRAVIVGYGKGAG